MRDGSVGDIDNVDPVVAAYRDLAVSGLHAVEFGVSASRRRSPLPSRAMTHGPVEVMVFPPGAGVAVVRGLVAVPVRTCGRVAPGTTVAAGVVVVGATVTGAAGAIASVDCARAGDGEAVIATRPPLVTVCPEVGPVVPRRRRRPVPTRPPKKRLRRRTDSVDPNSRKPRLTFPPAEARVCLMPEWRSSDRASIATNDHFAVVMQRADPHHRAAAFQVPTLARCCAPGESPSRAARCRTPVWFPSTTSS